MAIFWRAGIREGGLPLPLAFQYLILMISLLPSKCQDFILSDCHYSDVINSLLNAFRLKIKINKNKLRGLQFHFINSWKTVIPTLKTCYFEANEDIMTKFKSHALHIIRIKYWKASGSGNPPSLPHSCPPENCQWNFVYFFAHDCTLKVLIDFCPV
jgi:hypothetical protein